MTCKQCGSTVADGNQFCPNCGSAMTAPEEPTQNNLTFDMPQAYQPTTQPITTQGKTCSNCGASMAPDTKFCPVCGQTSATSTSTSPTYLAPPPKKKHGLAITLSIIAGVLVIAILVALLTNCLGFYGPGAKIAKAAEKTAKAGSLTVEVTSSWEYDGEEHSSTTTYEIEIDFEKRELALVATDENDEVVYAIYDGYLLEYYDSEYYGSGYDKDDISDDLEDFFDAYEDAYESIEDFNLEDLLDSIDEDAYDEAEDMLDMDEVEKSIKSMYRNLNSNSWLKKNAGYSKDKKDGATIYTFNPDLYDLAVATMEEFEDCFDDEDDYEDLMDELKDSRSDLRDVDITVSVGVKSGVLSSFEYTMKYGKRSTYTYSFEFSNVGTTGVDTDTLEDILEVAVDDPYGYDDYDYYF